MRFSISLAYLPVAEMTALAEAADRLGYHSVALADHVVDLEQIATKYPYTPDGARRWQPGAVPWPDPWVLFAGLAARTTRLRFFTSVYLLAMRDPFLAAKSIGTAAVLSGDRVALGVGVGWCREEFELIGADFGTRGRRTDEALRLLEQLLTPGVTEFEGEFYTAPRLTMEPTPSERVPVYVGGLSEVAMRRAARHDGWIGDLYTMAEAAAHARRLAELREEAGNDRPFSVLTALTDAFLPEHFLQAAASGVTDVMTMPWAYYHGLDADLDRKIDGLERFADEVVDPVSRALTTA